MRSVNTIEINGIPEQICPRIFQLAAELQDWPAILPHYRYIRIVEQSERHKVADFGASRDGFPVSWRARQELFPQDDRITFVHIRGVTRGMRVEWRLEKRLASVMVSIYHELSYPVPLFGPLFAHYVVGNLFVSNIAGKTLRRIKAVVEAEHPGRGT